MKHEYPFVIRPLSGAEGSGYLIEYPDLPGCISDGKTPEEAIANGRDAVKSYLFSCRKYGDKVPQPGKSAGGQRKPEHARDRDDCRRSGQARQADTASASGYRFRPVSRRGLYFI